MTLREFWGRLVAWRRRAEFDRALSEEMQEHLDQSARDLEAGGLTPAAARAAARRQLGNVTALREESREAWGFPRLDALGRDVRHAWRGLRRAPGFTATVIITLGLGIGANAAIFGVIDRAMFRPYPYLRDPGSVHRIYLETTFGGRYSANTVFPWLRYRDLQPGTPATFAAQSEWRFALGTGAATTIGRVAGISASFFGFFDAVPERGRFFADEEDQPPSGTPVAVLSHAFWISRFGGTDVIGRILKIGVIDYTIVGVAPPGFVAAVAGGTPDVFVPITSIPGNLGQWSISSYTRDYSWDWVQAFVRPAPGVSREALDEALTRSYRRSRASARLLNPRVLPDSIANPRAVAGPVRQAAGPQPGPEARVLLWATGVALIVLVIACANVANLMLARLLRRRRETSVRLALGVSRARLVGQFLVEGLLLAFLGGAAGLLVAQWGGVAIRALLLPDASTFELAGDWRTLGVAFGCVVVAAVTTSIGPALTATRTDLAGSLRSGAREVGADRSWVRPALLVLQATLSVVLLVGAGLFVRSFGNARGLPLGYDARPVLEVIPDFRGYQMDSAKAVAERERILAAARALPGVTAAARVNSGLFRTNTTDLRVDGIDSVAALGRFNMQVASPDYFDVMQIRILAGRRYDARDRNGTPPVVVVSEAMAAALWPGRDPLGQCLYLTDIGRPNPAPCTAVVGVAANTAQQNLGDDPRFMFYLPVAQNWTNSISTMYLRLAVPEPRGEMERVRRELGRVMPGDGFVVVRPLQQVVDDQSRSWRLGAVLFTAFGALALIVALVGLYGVISYDVAQRSHELGVRAALGAAAGDIVRLVILGGMRLALPGVLAGLGVALLASRWVEPLLFRLSGRDPATYLTVGGAVLLAALVATVAPGFRAARADPNVTLRAD